MHITNRDDLLVGDIATFTFNGHKFTGPLWEREEGTLFLGAESVRYKYNLTGEIRWSDYFDFISATREAPSLPTEPGSVILVTECRGERVDEPVLAMMISEGEWVTFGHMFVGYYWYLPEDITEWTPAKVVAA